MTWAANPLAPAATPLQSPCSAVATPDLGAAWAQATEAERDRARARLAAVQHAEELAAAGMRRLEADRIAAGKIGVSASAVGAWRYAAGRVSEAIRVSALLERPRTGRPPTIGRWEAEELEALVNQHGDHLSAEFARQALEARLGVVINLSTIRRWLKRHRRRNKRAISAVTNPDRHRSLMAPAGGDAAAGIVRINQLWELDSTIADVICLDGRRRALCAAIDIWSRRALFLVAPTSRAIALAALLRRCLLEWGVPEAVRTDEGADYTSRHFLGVLQDLEIAHRPCPPYTPEAKPFVERLIGTVSRGLFAYLPGFAGHSVAQAQAIRARKSFAARRGEAPHITLCAALSPEDLQLRIDVWAEEKYARSAHSGLDGASPWERATSWAGPLTRIGDKRALDMLLEESIGRTVQKKGVQLGQAFYIAEELGPLVREKVCVRRDPAAPGRIHVYRNLGDGRPGRFVCIAADPARTDIDQAETAARMKAAANRADRDSRARARELKKRLRPEDAMDDVLVCAAERSEKVVALPRRADVHEPPALAEAGRAAQAADETETPISPRRRSARARIAAANRSYLEDL